jgi:uncharacterized protein YqjF (DUF2071 family)
VHAPVEHEPWVLHRAELLHLDDELVGLGRLSVDGPPQVLWSPGVRVRIGPPQRL